MAAHKWANEIFAWAKGEAIQYNSRGMWEDFESKYDPNWASESIEWRIKPAEPERAVVETKMTATELCYEFDAGGKPGEKFHEELRRVANKAIDHALDAGQIVAREEFDKLHAELDRAVGDRKARDMRVAEAVARKYNHLIGVVWSDDLAAIISEMK